MVAPRVLFGVAASLAAAACAAPDGRPPIARAELTPEAIPENDAFQTEVTLDGARSADPADDPEGLVPLTHRWVIEGDAYELAPGSRLTDVAPVVRFRGDRPATITLTVTDADGLDDDVTVYVQLTAN